MLAPTMLNFLLKSISRYLPVVIVCQSHNCYGVISDTVLIGYYEYLETRPKNSHNNSRVIKGHLGIVTTPYFGRFCHRVTVTICQYPIITVLAALGFHIKYYYIHDKIFLYDQRGGSNPYGGWHKSSSGIPVSYYYNL